MIISKLKQQNASLVLCITSFLLITNVYECFAQTYTLNAQKSKITVSGTSNLHDWTMAGNGLTGVAELVPDESGSVTVSSLSISMDAESLKSHSKGMDKKAYKSLNTDNYPKIKYVLENIKTVQKDNGHYEVIGAGNITVSGVEKKIEVKTYSTVNGKNEIVCKGKFPLKMTAFNIKPPTAIFGTIRSGDAVMIDLVLTFLPK